MTHAFDAFVIFAGMRTGSNFLEANLNAFDGVTCHGEAFNPHFIGYPNRDSLLGMTRHERDADPKALLDALRAAPGLNGFRYFHDHDARILDDLLTDPRVAKIVLTRDPLDSYISRKIAQETGQWKLTNVARRKDARPRFDADEFTAHQAETRAFLDRLRSGMQRAGQAGFVLDYDDLRDLSVLNGLARWLGLSEQRAALDGALKPQNPEPRSAKVSNPDQMRAALARLAPDTEAPKGLEPARTPVVPSYVAAARSGLLYMPIRSGPEGAVTTWLAALDGVGPDALHRDFTQATLRQWRRDRPGHRSFTVVRHPLARAHDAFCSKILYTGPGHFAAIRRSLRQRFYLPLPEGDPDAAYDAETHRRAFVGFLEFVRANLAGQTALRVDAHWATQSVCLSGMAGLALPDMIVREREMGVYLPALAMQVGHLSPPDPEAQPNRAPHALAAIYDDRIEHLARTAYARDYLTFGFDDWDRD